MYVKPLEWSADYNLGVEVIDKAHQGLFRVVRKIAAILLENDQEKNRFACEESVKYLTAYTVKHFQEEELYMLQIGYENYVMHKHLHDNLRDVTLPALKKDLEETDYSKESVVRFISIIAGWLTGHIMIEDMAIVGKQNTKWKVSNPKEAIQSIDGEFSSFMKRAFNLHIDLFNAHYAGEPLAKPTCYEMTLKSSDLKIDVTAIIEESLLFYMVEIMLGVTPNKLDKMAIQSFIQVVQNCTFHLLNVLEPEKEFKRISHKHLDIAELRMSFKESFPTFSVLWKTDKGFVGFCERKIDK